MSVEHGLCEDFLDFMAALHDAGAEFIVVGAHAMAVHGVPRATGDLDVLVRPSDDNAERVLEALHEFGAPVVEHGLTKDDLVTPGVVYQIGLPPFRIDVITSIDGASFDEASESRVEIAIQNRPIGFLGKQILIRNKLATNREKDRADAHLLQRITADDT